jgi:hypothetical protein
MQPRMGYRTGLTMLASLQVMSRLGVECCIESVRVKEERVGQNSQGLCMAIGNRLSRYREMFKILIWFKRRSRSWWSVLLRALVLGLVMMIGQLP